MQASPKERIWAIVVYAVLLCVVQNYCIHSGLLPNEDSIWLFNGIASLLFGSRLLNPYFTPPVDAATNAFVAAASLLAAAPVVLSWTADAWVLGVAIVTCVLVFSLSIAVLLARPPQGIEPPLWVRSLDRAVRLLGSPNSIFTVVILVCVWLFHRAHPVEVFAILASWAVIGLLNPLEALLEFWSWLSAQMKPETKGTSIGVIAAYQSPNLALIRQSTGQQIAFGTTLLVAGEQGNWLLGVALNYVGHDEGNLLRTLTATLPGSLVKYTRGLSVGPRSGAALPLIIPEAEIPDVPALEWIDRLCGIVDNETTFEFLRFEVIDDTALSEGILVEARIGLQRSVLFQLIEGATHEEIVQQKNKYGYARAKARKIGHWDQVEQKFRHVSWLPNINTPVFRVEKSDFAVDAGAIGHFPGTSYGVSIDIPTAVTHNTAILGILGIGKTYAAAELVERMIGAGVRVLCLDLTDQYANLLAPFVDPNDELARRPALIAAGANGAPNQNRELGGSRNAFKQAVLGQMREFLGPQNTHPLRVINPASLRVTRQLSGMFNNNAELAMLTPCEITSIFSEAALVASQELGMVDEARLCIVYEEAHSLVPEWNSVASDGDKAATAASARAILQGRKFGLGCLLITQRTANVTKTILNQCNTILAMRTFDDTGKEFLSNYIGADYAGVLPSLDARHAVVFGKASSCENPVLVRLNDREDFLAVFRLQMAAEAGNVAAGALAAEPEPAEDQGANNDPEEV